MKSAAEYLDAIKARHGIDTDYKLMKLSGFSKQTISRWRTGKGHFDEESCLRVADLLDIDPAEVFLDASESRMHSPAAHRVFASIRDRLCIMSTSMRSPRGA